MQQFTSKYKDQIYGVISGFDRLVFNPAPLHVDFALVKSTKITERLTWQVRADAFELFNHPNFSQPGASPTNDSLVLRPSRY